MRNRLLPFAIALLCATCACAQTSLPSTNFAVLTREHTDSPCVVYNPIGADLLSLIAWQRDAGLDLGTNQVIFVVKEQAKLTLPAGTPFGAAGQPFWILPQSQNPNLLYLGVNLERVPGGVFTSPLSIRLTRLEGPGYFMAWQATGPGQYNIRINTRDGIDASDFFSPLIGAHEHFNWGFSTAGIYCATFQVTGQRIGETTNITSPESTFVFHVQPLPPVTNFSTWAKSHWPPGFNPPTTLASGNPDGDVFDNLHEYAFDLSPTNANPITDAPQFSFVTDGNERFGAITFTRYLSALDLDYAAQATTSLSEKWTTLTNSVAGTVEAGDRTERVTVRDSQSVANAGRRFYRLRFSLLPDRP